MIHQIIIQFGACFPYVVSFPVIYLKLYPFWSPIIYIDNGEKWLVATAFVSSAASLSARRCGRHTLIIISVYLR